MFRRRHTGITGTYPLIVSAPLCILSAVGMWCGGAPHSWWPCALAGIALLWILVHRARFRSALGWGFATGFIHFALYIHWVQISTGTIAATFALAAIQAAFVALAAVIWAGIWQWHARRPRAWTTAVALVLSAMAWIGIETLRTYVPFGGFPWALTAYSFVDSPLLPLAAIGSTELVGALAVIIAISTALAVRNAVTLRPLRALLAASIVLLCFWAPEFGAVTPIPSGSVRVGIVQGNAPLEGEVAPSEWSYETTRRHIESARPLVADKPELILFPESTSEVDYRRDAKAADLILSFARDADVPLVLGTQRYFAANDVDGTTQRTNDYVVQYPHGDAPGESDTYSKQHPVPFGEYVPFRDMFNKVTDAFDRIPIDMVPGEKPARLSVTLSDRTLHLAVPICFEVAYSQIVSDAVQGSDLLVFPTSNVLFGRSDQSAQQFQMARFRAVETGRSTIQVSTVGVSGVITPQGSVVYRSNLLTEDARVLDVDLYDADTVAVSSFAARQWAVFIGLALSCLCALRGFLKTGSHNRRASVRKTNLLTMLGRQGHWE